MITNGYSKNAQFRHSDKAPGRNLDALASRFDEEQILALEEQLFIGELRTVQRMNRFQSALSNPQPATPYLGPRFPKAQIPKQVRDDRVMFLRKPCRDNEARRPQKVTTGMSVQSIVSSLD